MERLIQIYAKNSQDVEDVYSIHKVCQCVADDELFAETGIEPEVLEIFSFYNKQMVKELKTERSASYDYLQKDTPGGGADNSEHDDESHGTHSDAGDADVMGGESQEDRAGSMQTEEAEALLVTSPSDLNKASMLVRQSVATSAMMHESGD